MFYIFEGKYDRKERKYNATLKGRYFLKKALKVAPLISADLALGYLSFAKKKYRSAASCYKKAYCISQDFPTAYNIALSYFRLQKYKQAMIWAQEAYNKGDDSEQIEALILWLFSSKDFKPKNYEQRLKVLFDTTDPFLLEDKFILTYLTADMEEAKKQIEPLLKQCWVTVPVIAMIFDCLLSQNNVIEAKSILDERLKQLEDCDYNVKWEIRSLKKAFSQEAFRKKLIASYQFIRPAIVQRCYQE